jgi:hypothetical protein
MRTLGLLAAALSVALSTGGAVPAVHTERVHAVEDVDLLDAVTPEYAESTMTVPAQGSATGCYLPRHAPAAGAVPGDASQIQAVYFVPADRTPCNHDRPQLCSNGA